MFLLFAVCVCVCIPSVSFNFFIPLDVMIAKCVVSVVIELDAYIVYIRSSGEAGIAQTHKENKKKITTRTCRI